MKSKRLKTVFTLALALICLGLSACSSTRSENGITIEQDRSINPLSWF